VGLGHCIDMFCLAMVDLKHVTPAPLRLPREILRKGLRDEVA